MQNDQSSHFAEIIEETLYRRVQDTINDYCAKNADAFAQNKIAGVEWELGITVLVDNLGLNPKPESSRWTRFKTFLQRTLNF